jgi:ribosome-associated translation inhibitor RaiA
VTPIDTPEEESMQIEVHSRGIESSDALRQHAARRARFALTRFGDRVRRLSVTVADENGPKGGVDMRCRIRADLHPRGEIVIRERHHDPFAAVARATERVAHAVSRRLQRLHARRRGRTRRSRPAPASLDA